RSDLEHQIKLPIVAATMLPQLRTRRDRATTDHLGVLHVIVPVCELALVSDVDERLLDTGRHVSVLGEPPHVGLLLASPSPMPIWPVRARSSQRRSSNLPDHY